MNETNLVQHFKRNFSIRLSANYLIKTVLFVASRIIYVAIYIYIYIYIYNIYIYINMYIYKYVYI